MSTSTTPTTSSSPYPPPFQPLTLNTGTSTTINNLPVEILVRTFSFLDLDTLTKLKLVCVKWNKILSEDYYWLKQYLTEFENKKPVFKRLSKTSWKFEYILRKNLISLYGSGSNPKQVSIGGTRKILKIYFNSSILIVVDEYNVKLLNKDLSSISSVELDEKVSCCKMVSNFLVLGFVNGMVGSVTIKDSTISVMSDLIELQGRRVVSLEYMSISDHSKKENNGKKVSKLIYFSVFGDFVLAFTKSRNVLCRFDLSKLIMTEIYSVAVDQFDNDTVRILVYTNKGLAVYFLKASCFEVTAEIASHLPAYEVPFPASSLHCKQFLLDSSSDICFVPVNNQMNVYAVKSTNSDLLHSIKLSGNENISCFILEGDTVIKDTKRIRKCALIIGTDQGNIYVYDISSLLTNKTNFSSEPLFKLSAHSAPVSTVHVDAFKIVVGHADGVLCVFDLLLGTLLRKVHVKYTMLQFNQRTNGNHNFDPVDCLVSTQSLIIVSYDRFLKVYDFDQRNELQLDDGKKKKKKRVSGILQSYRSPRAQLQHEAKLDKIEGNRVMLKEKSKISSHNLLAEEEQIAYAKMISLETSFKPAAFPKSPGEVIKPISIGSSSSANTFKPLNNASPISFVPRNLSDVYSATPISATSEEDAWPKLGTSQKSNSSLSSNTKSPGMKPVKSPPIKATNSPRPRKLSFSQFMDEFKLEEPAIPSIPIPNNNNNPENTNYSSSYRNVYRRSPVDSDEEGEMFDSHISDLYVQKRQSYSSVQVKKREQEDEDLLYALELSLVEQ